MSDDAAQPCPVCTTRKASPTAWRIVGETCSHLECPNRKPLTAAPARAGDGLIPPRGSESETRQ